MDNLELLIREFRLQKGHWLIVGDKEEKVKFENLEINYDMTQVLLLFSYDYSNIEIEINKYPTCDDRMIMFIPKGLHFTCATYFDDNKSLTAFLNQILLTWLKREMSNNDILLIWED